jgi:hypothetical protein
MDPNMAQLSQLVSSEELRVVFRAADPELRRLRDLIFSRYPHKEWATFFRCGWRVTSDGVALVLAVIDDPFNDLADIASEVSEFRRSSFEVKHRISIGGEVAVEGSETRVWAAQDPSNPVKLKGIPIPAAVIERFRA